MKAKVLKYKFDGNTVVAPYMELEAFAENVYLSLSDKNEYGNENYDYFHVVCKVENVYYVFSINRLRSAVSISFLRSPFISSIRAIKLSASKRL